MSSWIAIPTFIAAFMLLQRGVCQQCPDKKLIEKKIQDAKNELKVLEFTLSQCTIGQNSSNMAETCEEVFLRRNSYDDGNFWIKNNQGEAVLTHCAYQPVPNSKKRCMKRIGYLDMTESDQKCPNSQFREVTISGKRICARNMRTGGCASVTYSSNNILYKTICGRVKAYHYGSPSGFYTQRTGKTIDQAYLEGISITRGSPRKHIWSFANALADNLQPQKRVHQCPCMDPTGTQQQHIPSFVGQDYFCDAGSHLYPLVAVLHPDDPLWDGKGCEAPNTCCTFNNPPWFCKELDEDTTDNIELRLCADEDAYENEDSPIEQIEIYVK